MISVVGSILGSVLKSVVGHAVRWIMAKKAVEGMVAQANLKRAAAANTIDSDVRRSDGDDLDRELLNQRKR